MEKNVLLITHYAELYGANLSLVNILDEFKKKDINVHVVCPEEGDFSAKMREKNIPCVIIPFKTDLLSLKGGKLKIFLRKYKYYIKHFNEKHFAIKRIAQYIKDNNISLVHTNSICTMVGARAAKCAKIPHVWHVRECLEQFYNMTVPVNVFRKSAYKSTARFIGISETVKEYYKKIPREKFSVVYNGLPIKESDRTLRVVDKFIFVIVGVLQEGKKVDEAIKAFSMIQDETALPSELWVVGSTYPENDKTMLDYLKQIAIDNGVAEKVKFLGYIKNVHSVLEQTHCGVLCSKFEAFGRVLVEYMQNKMLVIANNAGACTEIVKDNKTGIIYESGNVRELADKMIYVVNNYDELKPIIEKGYNASIKNFTIERCSREIIEIYNEVYNNV